MYSRVSLSDHVMANPCERRTARKKYYRFVCDGPSTWAHIYSFAHDKHTTAYTRTCACICTHTHTHTHTHSTGSRSRKRVGSCDSNSSRIRKTGGSGVSSCVPYTFDIHCRYTRACTHTSSPYTFDIHCRHTRARTHTSSQFGLPYQTSDSGRANRSGVTSKRHSFASPQGVQR